MITFVFDITLCLLILAAAFIAVAGRHLFVSVIFFIVSGAFVSTAWIQLGAVDVALAEAAIGTGLTGVLLLGAAGKLKHIKERSRSLKFSLSWFIPAASSIAISVLLAWNFLSLPAPTAPSLADLISRNLSATGVENEVTAVLLNFRAWDTLLESIILLVAMLGVWAQMQDNRWGEKPGLHQHAAPDGVMASFGRTLPPIGLLVGAYLIWVGSHEPGGAFQGGTVLAAVGLLTVMAGLLHAPAVYSRVLRIALVIGPLFFLLVGLAGGLTGHFLLIPADYAKALTLTIEVLLAISIACALALLVLGAAYPEQVASQGKQP